MLYFLGNIVELKLKIRPALLKEELEQFKTSWHQYNPRKENYGRRGLSLTSLSGEMSGVPDLDSLIEYNKINGTKYEESSFKTWTPAAHACSEIKSVFNVFNKNISRSHLIRFTRGGFFPPHRDQYISDKPGAFRLFSVLSEGAHTGDYHFVLDGHIKYFIPGTIYYINTMLEHSLVSFMENLTVLVINVDQNSESIAQVQQNMAVR